MAVGTEKPPRPLAGGLRNRTGDTPTNRALEAMAEQIRVLEARTPIRVTRLVDLAVGINKINHGLGRPVVGVSITPTEASAGFAWCLITAGNTQPERQVWIEVQGIPMSQAPVEVW
jgi:hypothetical protein